ncbi:MAG: hypothetical protein COA58_13820 [Bacteroidetes bacterium]|nr:MAG: hypothetical protein COA58_13820 [Bacteroidota bacterium]
MINKIFIITLLIAISLKGFTQVTGAVFRDFNGDGTKQTNEPLVSNVVVNAYNSTDALCGTATTSGNSSPNYSLTGCGSSNVRLEFIIPTNGFDADSGIDYSALSGNIYGSAVRFVTGTSSNQNYALHYGGDYNTGAANSQLFIPKMNVNDPTGGGGGSSPGAQTAFFGFQYNNSGTTTPNKSVTGSTIGTTFGVAYSAQADVVFTSAFLKRHSGLGTLGSGGIYKLTPTSSSFTVNSFYDLDANGHRTRASSSAPAYGNGTSYSISGNTVTYLGSTDSESGSPVGLGVIGANSDRGLATDLTSYTNDPAAFDQVGKVSLGALEISDDGKYLFVVNLYNRKIYRLTLNNAYNPTSVTAVTSYNLPTTSVVNGVLRPFGIKYYRGSLFVGAVASGENGGSNTVGGSTDMYAYVFELEDAKGSPAFNATTTLSFGLNYRKGRPMSWASGSTLGNEWEAWTNNSGAIFIVSGAEGTYPTPILSDIDFSDRGDLIMDFMDRSGHQWGWQNRRYVAGTTNISYAVGGDLVIAGKNTSTGSYVLESNGSFVSVNGQAKTSGSTNSQGLGTSEFFKGEFYTTSHEETALGGVAVLKGQDEVATSVMDPNAIWSGGTKKLSTNNGAEVTSTGYTLYETASGSKATFGKANGLGELEILSEESPVEVGNRVWNDIDKDGIQDAGETGIAGVTVELCTQGPDGLSGTSDDVLVASVVTNSNGNYYFTTATGTSVTGITYNTSIDYDSNYVLKIGSSDWNSNLIQGTGLLSGKSLTSQGQIGNGKGGLSDNDAILSSINEAIINFSISDIGGNNHELDFGFKEYSVSIGDYVWLDTDGDGVQDASEVPLEGVVVCLYDNGGNPMTIALTGQCDSLVTDFTSSTDNDGSVSFTSGWSLSETNTYLDFLSNEFMVRGTGSGTRIIFGTRPFSQPTGYTVSSVEVCFDARQTDFDASSTDQLQVSYYNGTSWIVLATLDESDLTGTAQSFCYSSTTIPGLLNIENIEFRRLNYAFDEYAYVSNLNIKFCEASTSVDVKDTTDANGLYTFNTESHNLQASTQYEIRIPTNQDTIVNLVATVTGGGTGENDNNGTVGGSGTYITTGVITSPTTLLEQDTSFDFGFIGYSLGNVVWWDNDDNGNFDSDEIGIEGVKLYLLNNTGALIDSANTDAVGNYMFYGLLPGDYQVAVVSSLTSGILDDADISSVTTTTADVDDNNDGAAIDPVGVTGISFTSISSSVTIGNQAEPTTESDEDANTNYPDNQSNLSIDFGFHPPTTAVGNFVFWDKNNDGDFDAGADDTLANIKMYLYQDINGDGTPETIIDSVLTNSNGHYSFDSLGAGTFQIVVAGSNFAVGGPLFTGNATSNGNSQDTLTDNNSEGVSSSIFGLSPNTQNLSDANDGSSSLYDDDDANFTFDFGFFGTAGGPVPVEFVSFKAKPINIRDAFLTWSTATEINNDYFVIERSIDGSFVKIGEVKGQGTVNSLSEYSFLDKDVPALFASYRIGQVDYNGEFNYTEIRKVEFTRFDEIVIFPNPVSQVVHVKLPIDAIYSIQIVDFKGVVLSEVQGVSGLVDISLHDFASGTYIVRINGGNGTKTSRIQVFKN